MTYDPTIPTDLPPPSIAVDKIRTNFSQYASVFDNNHVALNANGQGKHSNVILQQQGSDPIVEGGFNSLYGKSVTSSSSTSNEVFVKIPQFLPDPLLQIPMQLTFNTVNNAGPIYQSFLANGYLVFIGSVTQPPGPATPQVVTLPIATSGIVCVIANPHNVIGNTQFFGASVSVEVISNTEISINPRQTNLTGVNYTYTWVAIAKQ